MDGDRLAVVVRWPVSADPLPFPRRGHLTAAMAIRLPSVRSCDDRMPDLQSGMLHRGALYDHRRQCDDDLCDRALYRSVARLAHPQGEGLQADADCRRHLALR